jgi:dihydroxy-acid dehydratase
MMSLCVSPETDMGGTIAWGEGGDTIAIDTLNRSIELAISSEELVHRTARRWTYGNPSLTNI